MAGSFPRLGNLWPLVDIKLRVSILQGTEYGFYELARKRYRKTHNIQGKSSVATFCIFGWAAKPFDGTLHSDILGFTLQEYIYEQN